MRVLVACEFSGVVRDEFLLAGHDAYSCDILPTESTVEGRHFQGDIFEVLGAEGPFDLMIAHPPCTYLTTTGNKWMKPEFAERFPDRVRQREDAIEFFMRLYNADVPRVCIENPVGVISSRFRKPDQYVHPYYFGEPHAKKTGLWLRGLPLLKPTKLVEPEYYTYESNGKRDPVWHMETSSLPKEEREKARSRTFKSIAVAMADQWGK